MVVLFQPLLDARSVEDLFATAALNRVLSHVDANGANERISELALTLDSVIPGELVAVRLCHHEVDNARLYLQVESLRQICIVLVKPRLIIRTTKVLLRVSNHCRVAILQKSSVATGVVNGDASLMWGEIGHLLR